MATNLERKLICLFTLTLLIAGTVEAQTITGSGTIGRIPKFSGTSVLDNSALFQSGAYLGLGTTTPARSFHLSTGATNDGVRVTQTTYGAAALDLYNSTA